MGSLVRLLIICGRLGGAWGKITWGTATAAYQVEGFREAAGREPSIWDAFDTANTSLVVSSTRPDNKPRVYGRENAAEADEDYVRFNESADLTAALGFGAARMSIAWPRVLRYRGSPPQSEKNEEGLAHYKRVLATYAAHNISVALTMFHWDLPLALEEYAYQSKCKSAWLCDWMPQYFEEYARVLLDELNATYWITINEPLTIVQNGYSGSGSHAPGRCADRQRCYDGDDDREPYVAAKTLLLAHARAFRAWEAVGRPGIGCGITLNGDNRVAFTEYDASAANRSLEWQLPLFFDPIFYGRWPRIVEEVVKPRLPDVFPWTPNETALVNGSHDGRHLFVNSYTSTYAREAPKDSPCYASGSFRCDARVEISGYNFSTGEPIGAPSSNGWLFDHGAGIRSLLKWYDARYPNRTFVITENGFGNASSKPEADIRDFSRCSYYRDYISNVSAAHVNDGVDVAAYFAWSLLDNYEWADGLETRFGLVYVNFDDQSRTLKHSAKWFKRHVVNATSLEQTHHLPACFEEKPFLG